MNVSIWGQTSDLIITGDLILWTVFLATCIRRSLSHSPRVTASYRFDCRWRLTKIINRWYIISTWGSNCLVPRPHFSSRPKRFGSRGPSENVRPRQKSSKVREFNEAAIVNKTSGSYFRVKNTPLKHTDGKRSFKRMPSFLQDVKGRLFFYTFWDRLEGPDLRFVLKNFCHVRSRFYSVHERIHEPNFCYKNCFSVLIYGL